VQFKQNSHNAPQSQAVVTLTIMLVILSVVMFTDFVSD